MAAYCRWCPWARRCSYGATCNICGWAGIGCRLLAVVRAMDMPPEQIISRGLYRFTRNPMYLGHLVFLLGLAVTFWSWFALIILCSRAFWFHRRVLQDEERLEGIFGAEYAAYRARVKRWIPGIL